MDQLVIILALNGALVLTISMIAGLFLYLSILNDRDPAAWHLLHAGGTGRGVMLLALAALIEIPALSDQLAAVSAWLIIFFVWTSMLAMGIRAISGDRGLRFDGPFANRLVYVSYGLGTLAVFPGFALLIYGLLKALLPT
ncbi:MAG: hypothetical protein OEU50_18720 [Gammaproteobacteria bacterium]|nr:hypothetical protein [Gammaproteobacteria bacterium]